MTCCFGWMDLRVVSRCSALSSVPSKYCIYIYIDVGRQRRKVDELTCGVWAIYLNCALNFGIRMKLAACHWFTLRTDLFRCAYWVNEWRTRRQSYGGQRVCLSMPSLVASVRVCVRRYSRNLTAAHNSHSPFNRLNGNVSLVATAVLSHDVKYCILDAIN